MLRFVTMLAVLTITVPLAAGCGGSAGGTGDEAGEEETVAPDEAIAEIAAVRTALTKALASYRAGDADAAEQTVGDAYLDHFERVERALGERDHELMEEIEEQLASDLREEIKAGRPEAEIRAAVRALNDDLDEAVGLLGG